MFYPQMDDATGSNGPQEYRNSKYLPSWDPSSTAQGASQQQSVLQSLNEGITWIPRDYSSMREGTAWDEWFTKINQVKLM